MFASMFEIRGWIFADEALHCCHDCLSTLCNAILIGILHKDINTEHVMWVVAVDDKYYYV
jgi:hypothetical protein